MEIISVSKCIFLNIFLNKFFKFGFFVSLQVRFMNIKRATVNISRKPIKIIGKFFGFIRRLSIIDYFFSFVFMCVYQLPTSPTHYYSPLPDLNKLKRNNKRWLREITIKGHEWNDGKQIENIQKLKTHKSESGQISDIHDVNKSGYGEGFPPVEAEILYYMIRELKPSKVIEVGSGVSTYYSLKAIEMNNEKDNINTQMICVEPYPREKFQSFADAGKILYYKQQAQDVDLSVFKLLEEGDVLFIDSSHVLKADSDVTYLYLDVLPSLNKGVIIHIHDIC